MALGQVVVEEGSEVQPAACSGMVARLVDGIASAAVNLDQILELPDEDVS